jgi:hypothetical protein
MSYQPHQSEDPTLKPVSASPTPSSSAQADAVAVLREWLALYDEGEKGSAESDIGYAAWHSRLVAAAESTRSLLSGEPKPALQEAAHPDDLKWLARQPMNDWGGRIVYDTEEVDTVTHALTGDEGEDDSLTVLIRLASYVENVWPGKCAQEVLLEYEVALSASPATGPISEEAELWPLLVREAKRWHIEVPGESEFDFLQRAIASRPTKEPK